MIVQYHELSAMIGVGRPGSRVYLDDLHKAAWSLYTGTGEMKIPPGVERPFTFRADSLPGRPGTYLFTLRSPFAFARAKEYALTLDVGTQLGLEVVFSPFARRKDGNNKSVKVIVGPDGEQDVATKRFKSAGLAPGSIEVSRISVLPIRHGNKAFPVIAASTTVTVTSPAEAMAGWLYGVSPMKAYGMGQLTLLPDSSIRAEAT